MIKLLFKLSMKNSSEETKLLNNNFGLNNNIITDKNKTTNVNVLLNRVKLDKKNDLKKKLFSLTFLIAIITSITIFVLF